MRESEFEELMKQYQNLVFTVCYQLVEDYQEAQNLTQETFLAAYRFVDNCEGKHIRPWLCRVAANKAKDFLKSSYRRRTQLDGEGALTAAVADSFITLPREPVRITFPPPLSTAASI